MAWDGFWHTNPIHDLRLLPVCRALGAMPRWLVRTAGVLLIPASCAICSIGQGVLQLCVCHVARFCCDPAKRASNAVGAIRVDALKAALEQVEAILP